MPPLDLSLYGLVEPVECSVDPHQGTSNTVLNIRTGAERFIWKQYGRIHELASIHYEHRLLRQLAEVPLSFALPTPIATREGGLLTRQGNAWGALAPFFHGHHCNAEDLQEIELLGAATGELQRALKGVSVDPRPGYSLFQALFDFPRPAIEPLTLAPQQAGASPTPDNDQLCGWWREEAARLEAFTSGVYRSLPWQVCHNDLTPANVLVDQGRVVAVLDFEFACPAARALDVAMGLRMTMRIWENPEPWDAVRRYMHGFGQFVSLSPEEIRALPTLLRLRSAIPTLWSIGRRTPHVIRSVGYLQNMARWLEQWEEQLIEVVTEAASEENTA